MSTANWFDELQGGEISESATEEWNQSQHLKTAMREQAATATESPLDKLSAEQIRELWMKSSAAEEKRNAEARVNEACQTFLAEETRYIANPRNAARVNAYLEARYGDSPATADRLHEAFTALNERGLLQVRPQPAQPRKRISEQDMENMPLEQLRELAEQELQRPGSTRVVR